MSKAQIRMARPEDSENINHIYETYILNTAITFEYEPVSSEEFRKRVTTILKKLPYLVCEINDKIVGYAYVAPFYSRAAFAWDLEITVYVHEDYYRKNIGKALYQALFYIAEELGYVNIYALITEPNENSKKMHKAMGFQQVGLYPETGYKFGKWWGLNVMCKQIGNTSKEPKTIRNIHELSEQVLSDIFEKAQERITL